MVSSIRSASFVRSSRLVLVAMLASGALLVGCASEAEEDVGAAAETTTQEVASAKEPGIDVKATWRRVVTGVPTYGYEATEPFLALEITVDDAKVRAQHSGFDGFERPFALVPRAGVRSGDVRWERVELAFRGESRHGYYGEQRRDVYEVKGIRLAEADVEVVLSLGVAVGLETNVGTVWAQDPGDNTRPVRALP